MLIATGLVLLGIATVIAIDRRLGGRSVGRPFVPILAVFALYRWYVLPVFLLAAGLTWLLMPALERRTLVAGQWASLVAIGIGAVATLMMLVPLVQVGATVGSVAIAGSLLPGAAAHRLQRAAPQARWRVVVGGIGTLLVAGVLGSIAAKAFVTPPCLTCGMIPWERLSAASWFLLNPTSDLVAVVSGLPAGQGTEPSPLAVLGVVVMGAVLATGVKLRWGLGLLGPVALPLLAMAVLGSRWALVVYLLATGISFLVVEVLSLRIALVDDGYEAAAVVAGLLATSGLSVAVPLPGPTAFVVGVLAGYGGHRWHALAPPNRLDAAAVATGVFSAVVGVGWATLEPSAGVSVWYVAVGLLAVAVAAGVLYRYERELPSRESVAAGSIVREGL